MTIENADALFDSCISDIESEYARLGHRLGWRFLAVPKSVLRNPVKIALISLHPGGDYEPAEHPRGSCEVGNWYTSESWGDNPPGASSHQQQVRLMFRAIGDETDFRGPSDELISQSLVANFVPFRSPSFALLHKRDESVAFARALWGKVLPHAKPRLLVCLGREAHKGLQKVIPDSLGLDCTEVRVLPTGWGTLTATLQTFGSGANQVRVLTLPHLSRFRLFTSGLCAAPMKLVMSAACDGL